MPDDTLLADGFEEYWLLRRPPDAYRASPLQTAEDAYFEGAFFVIKTVLAAEANCTALADMVISMTKEMSERSR